MGGLCLKGSNTNENYLPPTDSNESDLSASIMSSNMSILDDGYKSSIISNGVFSNDPNYTSEQISMDNF